MARRLQSPDFWRTTQAWLLLSPLFYVLAAGARFVDPQNLLTVALLASGHFAYLIALIDAALLHPEPLELALGSGPEIEEERRRYKGLHRQNAILFAIAAMVGAAVTWTLGDRGVPKGDPAYLGAIGVPLLLLMFAWGAPSFRETRRIRPPFSG